MTQPSPKAFWLSLTLLCAIATACSSGPTRPTGMKSGAAQGDDDVKQKPQTGEAEDTKVDRLPTAQCKAVSPGRSPLRRLSRFEYSNTLKDLVGDTTQPGSSLPAEEYGNGFGNDAEALSASSLLIAQYSTISRKVATKAVTTAATLTRLAPCAAGATAQTEQACVDTFLAAFLPQAFRRPVEAAEVADLNALYKTIRPLSANFPDSLASLMTAIMQTPDFLYRVELGDAAASAPAGVVRPSNYEMATRLSYLFTGSMPDAAMRDAAAKGKLTTVEGITEQAERLLEDPRSRETISYFFNMLLPIDGLTDLDRDKTLFPNFNSKIGSYMYQETQKFLEYLIFEGSGKWSDAFDASYTFVNEPLAKYYGIAGVTGDAFQKVKLDPATKRIGLLTQGGILAGTAASSITSPVARGIFVAQKLLCQDIPSPTGDLAEKAKTPVATEGTTARERFLRHSEDAVCATCHRMMDPLGLTFETYDAGGMYRALEGKRTIDPTGALPPGIQNAGAVANLVELSQRMAKSDTVNFCFADKWMTFAYGKTLIAEDDCSKGSLEAAFKTANFDVKTLLLGLTQTDAFLYRLK